MEKEKSGLDNGVHYKHDIESEFSFSSTYINDHAKSTAQTLLFMMINLRGVVNEALHNPQTRQAQTHQFYN